MSFAGKVWKILVGIKDGLVLLFMLLFFIGLFAVLSARPNPGQVRDGVLLRAPVRAREVEAAVEHDPVGMAQVGGDGGSVDQRVPVCHGCEFSA